MNTQKFITTWFEIPSTDFNRACAFYESILTTTLKREECGPMMMAVFAHTDTQTGGAIVHGAPYQPSKDGACVYLYTDELDAVLVRVVAHGGQIQMPRMSIGENGFIAHIIDSEGNRVGLHTAAK